VHCLYSQLRCIRISAKCSRVIVILIAAKVTAWAMYRPKRNADKQLCTSTCFAIFELIKFTCFGSTLSYLHKEFLNPRQPHTRTKSNPHPPCPTACSTCTALHPHAKQWASHTRPTNVGTRNPCMLTQPVQDSNTHYAIVFMTNVHFLCLIFILRFHSFTDKIASHVAFE